MPKKTNITIKEFTSELPEGMTEEQLEANPDLAQAVVVSKVDFEKLITRVRSIEDKLAEVKSVL